MESFEKNIFIYVPKGNLFGIIGGHSGSYSVAWLIKSYNTDQTKVSANHTNVDETEHGSLHAVLPGCTQFAFQCYNFVTIVCHFIFNFCRTGQTVLSKQIQISHHRMHHLIRVYSICHSSSYF